jgi:hypothetical protein
MGLEELNFVFSSVIPNVLETVHVNQVKLTFWDRLGLFSATYGTMLKLVRTFDVRQDLLRVQCFAFPAHRQWLTTST